MARLICIKLINRESAREIKETIARAYTNEGLVFSIVGTRQVLFGRCEGVAVIDVLQYGTVVEGHGYFEEGDARRFGLDCTDRSSVIQWQA